MKKAAMFGLMAVLVLSLAACGSKTAQRRAGQIPGGAPGGDGDQRSLPVLTELIVGTFKLESSDVPVDAEQARELLPLWKTYVTLSDKDSASSFEVDALVNQIQRTMTDEQMAAIEAMNLSNADVTSVVNEFGVDLKIDTARDSAEDTGPFGAGGFGGGGRPGGGGMPGGGGVMPGGGGGMPGMMGQEGAEVEGAMPGGGAVMVEQDNLIKALIDLLESKVQP